MLKNQQSREAFCLLLCSNCTSISALCETPLGSAASPDHRAFCGVCFFGRTSRSPPMRLSDLAEKLSCRLEGDPSAEIAGIAGMDHATSGQVTFLANRRYFPLLHSTRATAIF